jgi:hypothetical protein
MKRLLVVALLAFGVPLYGQFSTVSCTHGETGTCRQATTCSQANVQATVTASAAGGNGYISPTSFQGDGVYVPAGTCSWGSSVSWTNKNINLIGGVGGTTTLSHSSDAFDVHVSNSGATAAAFRISNFTFSGSTSGDLLNLNGSAQGSGTVPTVGTAWAGFFRVDNLTYNYSSSGNVFIIFGNVFGVFDHLNGTTPSNHFEQANLLDAEYNAMHSGTYSQFEGEYAGRLLSAAPGSSSPGGLGSKYMDFIEDSTFSCPGNYSGAISDSESGGQRMVFRHNTLTGTCFHYAHWTRGDEWDGDLYEIYNNSYNGGVNGQFPARMEAGTGVFFNNTLTNYTDLTVHVDDRRADGSETSAQAFACDGSQPIDGNAGDSGAPGWPCAGQIGNACLNGGCVRGSGGSGLGSLPLILWNNSPSLGVTVGSGSGPYIKTTTHSATNLNGAKDYCVGSTTEPATCGIYTNSYTPYTYPYPTTTGGTSYTLTVSTAGTGSGSISTCSSGTYASGTAIVCNASASTGSTFVGWSGGSCSGTGSCSFSLLANATVTATFTLNSWSLSTATSGTGTGTVTGCAGVHNFGASYSCTVTPSGGSSLSGVTGCGGSGTTLYTGTMPNANCIVTATFVAPVTWTQSISGSGTVIGTNSASGTYPSGTTIGPITASPNTGYSFAGWSGATGNATCSGLTNPCPSFTLTSNSSATATFTQNSYTLSTSTTGTGTGTITGCAGSLHYADAYSCTVTASAGSTLTSVSGCGGSGTTTYAGTMPATSCTVTAAFATSAATPTFSPVAGSYGPTQNVTISSSTAGATICYTTNGSSPTASSPGVCAAGSTQYTTPVTVASSLTLKAISTKTGYNTSSIGSAAYVITGVSFTLAVSTAGSGSGSLSGSNCASGTYPSGTTITCSQSASTGSTFAGWSGGSCSGTGSCSFSLLANATVTGTFTLNSWTLSTATAGTGSGTVTGCAGAVNFGASYSCTVTASGGSTLTSVAGCGGSGTTTFTGTMPNTNCTVTATFATSAATPTFSPVAGSYGPTQNVTISTGTSGATICYRTDGTNPSSSSPGVCAAGSTQYVSPVSVSSSLTIKAIATKIGYNDSSVASAAYVINGTVSSVTFSPVAGSYGAAQTVTLTTSTSGATKCYTTDGSTPTSDGAGTCTHGTTYSTPFSVSTSQTVNAIASKSGFSDSPMTSAAYTINGTLPTPTFTPAAGGYPTTQHITISASSGSALVMVNAMQETANANDTIGSSVHRNTYTNCATGWNGSALTPVGQPVGNLYCTSAIRTAAIAAGGPNQGFVASTISGTGTSALDNGNGAGGTTSPTSATATYAGTTGTACGAHGSSASGYISGLTFPDPGASAQLVYGLTAAGSSSILTVSKYNSNGDAGNYVAQRDCFTPNSLTVGGAHYESDYNYNTTGGTYMGFGKDYDIPNKHWRAGPQGAAWINEELCPVAGGSCLSTFTIPTGDSVLVESYEHWNSGCTYSSSTACAFYDGIGLQLFNAGSPVGSMTYYNVRNASTHAVISFIPINKTSWTHPQYAIQHQWDINSGSAATLTATVPFSTAVAYYTTSGSATICYTLDGTTPTGNGAGSCTHGTTYSGPITIASTTTVKAIATQASFLDSVVGSATYTINGSVSTPTFSPGAGTYGSSQSVTLSTATSGATICWTSDGTTPTADGAGTCTHGTTYSGAIVIAATLTLQAVASKVGYSDSSIGSASYVITSPPSAVIISGQITISGAGVKIQ